MFYGEYRPNLDSKGRFLVPVKLREGLKDKFIITKGLDNCLYAYSLEEWDVLSEKVKALPQTDKDVRAFMRIFFSGAYECEVDKQGRVVVPGNLREFAGLTKETYIIGVSSRVEIWSSENWKSFAKSENASPDIYADKMASLGI
ncbi:MAG: division/cell wall cluster transcriptional repressor MraZ [Bacillota bacterium]